MRRQDVFQYVPLLGFMLFVLFLSFFVPQILSVRNVLNVLNQSVALGFMSIGITLVMITGGIDLSSPSVMALGGILGAIFMRDGGSTVVGVLIMILVCTILGSFNGFVVAYLKMVPFVVTLSMMYVAMGASIWLTREVSISGLPADFIGVFAGRFFGVPFPILLFFLTVFFAFEILGKGRYGRWLYATGSNPTVARLFGIPTEKVVFAAYTLSGLFAGIAAVVTTARLLSASSKMGSEGVILNVVGAAVVGGVSVYGAEGSVLGAAVGAIFMTFLENIMNMMRVSYYMSLLAKGVLVIAIVAFDALRRGKTVT
ncbi:MAG: ABC transporter permease [Candidatus Methanomethylicaceae archaeon]